MVTAASAVLLGDGHSGVVAAFHLELEALGDEVQFLGDGHIHTKGGLVLVLVTGPVVVLPTVPLGKGVRQGLGGYHSDGQAVNGARAGRRVGPQHRTHPDVVRSGDRLLGVAYHTADVELHIGCFRELEVKVGAVVITVVGEVVVVGYAGNLLQETVLEHITH